VTRPTRTDQTEADDAPLVDLVDARPVVDEVTRLRGMKWDVITQTVALTPEVSVSRDVVVHPGAVGVVALDDADRVQLLLQYRHPVGRRLWELPAGLLDIAEESALLAAQRELAEEAGLVATQWNVLVDVYSSPGMCSEAYRIYLARGLQLVPAEERHVGQAEEAELVLRRVPLDDAVAAVTAGDIHNAMAVVGILAADNARADGWQSLRDAEAAWPERSNAYHERVTGQ
jgi:8-oxo-dGTP pyrophosphatase MutT (NUDIX family)